MRYKNKQKLLAWGDLVDGDDYDDDSKGLPVGGIHVDKPQEIVHAHAEHPTGITH